MVDKKFKDLCRALKSRMLTEKTGFFFTDHNSDFEYPFMWVTKQVYGIGNFLCHYEVRYCNDKESTFENDTEGRVYVEVHVEAGNNSTIFQNVIGKLTMELVKILTPVSSLPKHKNYYWYRENGNKGWKIDDCDTTKIIDSLRSLDKKCGAKIAEIFES